MKGICFTEPLFHATVEGRKTQTRRIIKPQPRDIVITETGYKATYLNDLNRPYRALRPRFEVDEVVYLKEPYFDFEADDGKTTLCYKYRGDQLGGLRWRNKLFMPAESARYFIRITAVRAERLKDISDQDCRKEGLSNRAIQAHGDVQKAYAALIDRINGRGTWDSNPWVWVYDYELLNQK